MNNATLGNAFNSRNKQTTQLKFPENITIQDKKPDANVNRTSFHTPTQLQQLHCTICSTHKGDNTCQSGPTFPIFTISSCHLLHQQLWEAARWRDCNRWKPFLSRKQWSSSDRCRYDTNQCPVGFIIYTFFAYYMLPCWIAMNIKRFNCLEV